MEEGGRKVSEEEAGTTTRGRSPVEKKSRLRFRDVHRKNKLERMAKVINRR
jgi:hypothetical protein